jgi:hypothetical protein
LTRTFSCTLFSIPYHGSYSYRQAAECTDPTKKGPGSVVSAGFNKPFPLVPEKFNVSEAEVPTSSATEGAAPLAAGLCCPVPV